MPFFSVLPSATRRVLLTLAPALAALALTACAWNPSPRPEVPPIVFVHGNGDSAAVWQTTMWRFESNGWPRDRLFALQQPWPLARDDDSKPQEGRSSTEDSLQFLRTEVAKVQALTGAKKVVLMANSRGGLTIRNYIQNGGGAQTVSHAILGGSPNHGVWAIPGFREGNEFSGTGPFLKKLNTRRNDKGDEVDAGVQWLTLRSDNNDKYAQPEGTWIGAKGKPTGVTVAGPELKGATNLVAPRIDHRETSFSPTAFDAAYRFITGQAPQWTRIWPEYAPELDGSITGQGLRPSDNTSGNFSNNLPLPGARLEIYAVSGDSGERLSPEPVYRRTVGDDGRWGPFRGLQGTHYEFVIRATGYATTHIYRSPFLRGSQAVHLRAERFANDEMASAAVIRLTRPRGYFDPTNNFASFDGQSPPPGITVEPVAGLSSSRILLPKPQNRAIRAEFHTDEIERVVGRTWAARDNHLVVLELTN